MNDTLRKYVEEELFEIDAEMRRVVNGLYEVSSTTFEYGEQDISVEVQNIADLIHGARKQLQKLMRKEPDND